eukprot:2094387-Alexandrium_andersonii.AAC.1
MCIRDRGCSLGIARCRGIAGAGPASRVGSNVESFLQGGEDLPVLGGGVPRVAAVWPGVGRWALPPLWGRYVTLDRCHGLGDGH